MRLFWPIQSFSFPKIYNQHLGVPSSLVTSWRWLSRRRIVTVTLHVILRYCWSTDCLCEIWSFPKLIFNFTTRFNERLFNNDHQPTTHQRWIRLQIYAAFLLEQTLHGQFTANLKKFISLEIGCMRLRAGSDRKNHMDLVEWIHRHIEHCIDSFLCLNRFYLDDHSILETWILFSA